MAGKRSQQEAATELALAVGALVRRVRAVTAEESRELSWTQVAVMNRLSNDGAMTTAELARAENVRPQSMGATVAELEAQQMVERRAHPTDGRQMLIGLTAEGERVRNEGKMARRAWLSAAIARLDAEQQRELPAMTALIKRLAEM